MHASRKDPSTIKLPRNMPKYPSPAQAKSSAAVVELAFKFKNTMRSNAVPSTQWGRLLLQVVPAHLTEKVSSLCDKAVTYRDLVHVLLQSSVGGCYQSDLFQSVILLRQGTMTVSEYYSKMLQVTQALHLGYGEAQRRVIGELSAKGKWWHMESECFVLGLNSELRNSVTNRYGDVGYIPMNELSTHAQTIEFMGNIDRTGSSRSRPARERGRDHDPFREREREEHHLGLLGRQGERWVPLEE